MRKKLKQSLLFSCLIVMAITVVALAIIGLIIALVFIKDCTLSSGDWLAFLSGYIGTSLALVGTVLLGYIAIRQTKQAQDVNDRLYVLEESRAQQENVSMIEFDANYGGGYRTYWQSLFQACPKFSVSYFVVSDVPEAEFISKVNSNEKIDCLCLELYFKETIGHIKNIYIHNLEFNKALGTTDCFYKKFYVMSWQKDGILCSYIPNRALRKMEIIFDIQDKEYWKLLNEEGQLSFDIELELKNFLDKSTLVEFTVNLGQIKEKKTKGYSKVDILKFNSLDEFENKTPYVLENIDIEKIKF